ncbi:MAG: Zn-ribbon domain-containing OB-fold protein [Candidatus Bathyarchaeota archaeon]|nr:MAG: Zn-ribbon domain-containing OB-fold protein [Candidatus Bathyarchaeota archaeon]
MSFSSFGKIGYVSETKVEDFVRFLEKGKIMATKCRRCGKLYFPPRADCPDDLSSDVTWQELSGHCKLLTFTTVYFAPTGFQDDLPYSLALVQCEEGVKVFAPFSKDVDEGKVHIGMNLRLAPKKLPNRRITYELKQT